MTFQTSTAGKLGAYALSLTVIFGAAFSIGAVVDPLTAGAEVEHGTGGQDGHGSGAEQAQPHGDEHGDEPAGADAAPPPGLAASEAGYTLVPGTTSVAAAGPVPFSFIVTDPDGLPLTEYVPTHEKDLHLIVVRRDLSGFQHVHPIRDSAGTWSVPLELAAGGTYRVFADFAPAGLDRTLTLGTDLAVAGQFVPVPLPEPATTSSLEGYDVTVTGTASAGMEAQLTFTVSRDGQALTDLEPYLGAYGHLVSLRVGDLAYLHTHPTDSAEAGQQGGPAIEFGTTFPTAGTYRLFMDFQHDGAVHTAEFTVLVDD